MCGMDPEEGAPFGSGGQQFAVLGDSQAGQGGVVRVDEPRSPQIVQLHPHLEPGTPI
jgi:hypothetical protein